MSSSARILLLAVTPHAKKGDTIRATIESVDLGPVTVSVDFPDTMLLAGEKQVHFKGGTVTQSVEWQVEHVQKNSHSAVEIRAESGDLIQIGLCQVRG